MKRKSFKFQMIAWTLIIITILSILTYFSYTSIENIIIKEFKIENNHTINLGDIKKIISNQLIISIFIVLVLFYKVTYFNLKNSYIDYLTQIKNKKFLDIKLKEYIKKSKIKKSVLSVMMIDVDDFKNINDMYGHQVGDMILRYIADTIKSNVRNNDICCKYGGDEFIVVLPNTEIKQAEIIANRINNRLMENPYILNEGTGETVSISVSIGIAETMEDINEAELIKCADKALYEAKAKGKRTVMIYN